jgi:hypothetical protein
VAKFQGFKVSRFQSFEELPGPSFFVILRL